MMEPCLSATPGLKAVDAAAARSDDHVAAAAEGAVARLHSHGAAAVPPCAAAPRRRRRARARPHHDVASAGIGGRARSKRDPTGAAGRRVARRQQHAARPCPVLLRSGHAVVRVRRLHDDAAAAVGAHPAPKQRPAAPPHARRPCRDVDVRAAAPAAPAARRERGAGGGDTARPPRRCAAAANRHATGPSRTGAAGQRGCPRR